jgi:hypothetical protein
MAIYDQPKLSYDDTVPQVRIIDEAIRLIDPIDTPLMAALGGLNGASSKFNVRGNGKVVELLEDTYHPTGGSLALADMAHDSTTAAVTDGSIYQSGHVLKIEDEYVIVKSVAANILTFTERAYGGTNATHTSTNGTISIVGMAREEGDDASYVGLQTITSLHNYTQILEKALSITGTDEAIDYYGMASPFAFQAKKALPDPFRWMELGLFHGIRDAGAAAAGEAYRSFGGLKTFVTSNTTDAGGQITKQDVDTLVYDCFVDGGSPDLLVINPHAAGDLKALLDNKDYLRVPIDGNKLGRPPVEYVVTQWGTLRILMDRWCPLAEAFALSSKDAGLYQLRPFAWKPLAVTGDSKKGEVVGEFSFLVANAAGMGYIYGIT